MKGSEYLPCVENDLLRCIGATNGVDAIAINSPGAIDGESTFMAGVRGPKCVILARINVQCI
jgi:hypothetical protein